jgi:hypothetical protein
LQKTVFSHRLPVSGKAERRLPECYAEQIVGARRARIPADRTGRADQSRLIEG